MRRRLAYEEKTIKSCKKETSPKNQGTSRELVNRRTSSTLRQLPNAKTVKGKRDRAILSILLGCGLRRRELAELTLDHLQQREDHWAVVDLIGKAGHIRTVPVPDWVKQITDEWVVAAGVGVRDMAAPCPSPRSFHTDRRSLLITL